MICAILVANYEHSIHLIKQLVLTRLHLITHLPNTNKTQLPNTYKPSKVIPLKLFFLESAFWVNKIFPESEDFA